MDSPTVRRLGSCAAVLAFLSLAGCPELGHVGFGGGGSQGTHATHGPSGSGASTSTAVSGTGGASTTTASGTGGGCTTCDAGVCADLTQDPDNCGACGNVCTTAANNMHPACTLSDCTQACDVGWADCDNDLSTGCEFDVSGDTQNCGACGHLCGNANTIGGTAVCQASACVFNCAPGTAHCSASDATGCETTIATDKQNCGSCGFDCGSATCENGFCRYTTGTEFLQPGNAVGSLVSDATTLYWFNNDCNAPAIRRVEKDGTGLRDVWAGTAKVGCPVGQQTLAIDKNFIYFLKDYKEVYRGVKTGAQDPTLFAARPTGTLRAILLDTDPSQSAQHVFTSWEFSAMFGFDVATPTNVATLPVTGGIGSLARSGSTVYFTVSGSLSNSPDNAVRAADMSAVPPTDSVFFALPSWPAGGMAIDGTNLYVPGYDGVLYSVDLLTKNSKQLATGGPGQADAATDGVNVYVTGMGALYRVPVDGNGPYANYQMFPKSALPTGNFIRAVEVDATALYFATEKDIFKTRK